MLSILAQSDGGVQDAFQVWVAHADLLHVIERVADVIDTGPTHADSLRHEARAAVEVELAHVRRMGGIGHEREGANRFGADPYRDEARFVDAARHLAVPEPRERAPQARRIDAVRHAPA